MPDPLKIALTLRKDLNNMSNHDDNLISDAARRYSELLTMRRSLRESIGIRISIVPQPSEFKQPQVIDIPSALRKEFTEKLMASIETELDQTAIKLREYTARRITPGQGGS